MCKDKLETVLDMLASADVTIIKPPYDSVEKIDFPFTEESEK